MNRETVLRDAERHAKALRRSGYVDAEVAPEYCIASIGYDGYWTYTVSVYAGKKRSAQEDLKRRTDYNISGYFFAIAAVVFAMAAVAL